ncbi:MAG: glycosyltransferase family 2 protein [Rikenellaceae bacterium]
MKVSIITACYNRETTIRECIESALAQEYNNIEYIVVDGASIDRSLEIIDEYRDKITTIISEPDSGMYEAINKGIRAASGDIIGLLHSDDTFYSPDAITKVVREMESEQADMLYANGLFVAEDNHDKIIRNWISGAYEMSNIPNGWLPLHPTVYIRRECFTQKGVYDESYKIAADSDLLVRYMYNNDLKITYLDDYLVKMRMGGLSTDPQKIKQKWREDIRMYRSHGLNPYWALGGKILSKIPQFISAKLLTLNDKKGSYQLR